MKVAYIAGPIRKGNIWHNVGQADDAMLELMQAGFAVINPILSCWAGAASQHQKSVDIPPNTMLEFPRDGKFVFDPVGVPHPLAHGLFRDLGAEPWLTMDLELVKRSDAVLRLPGESSGADGEVAHAESLGIPVFHSIGDLESYFGVES